MLSREPAPERRFRIAYLIDGLSMGGAERLMVPILQNLDRARFKPFVCALQSKDGNPVAEDLRALDVPVECMHFRRLRDPDAIPRLLTYLKRVGAELVHTQLEAANVLGTLSARLRRLPSVSTIHVLPSLEVKARTRLHQKVEWFVLRHFCDRVIAVSGEARSHHLRLSGSPADQVTTIYNGIDPAPFEAQVSAAERREVRRELGIPGDSQVLVTVAVLRPLKGIQFMIRALPGILAAHPDTCYLIVGDGEHRDALVEEAKQAGVSGRVIFAGLRRDVPRLLAASDVFVLPSLTEALPTVLAEAMAARLPVVASTVGGIPEMITPGENGLLVEPGDIDGLTDACSLLLGDPQQRAAMGEGGWQIVHRRFSIQRQVEELKDLYLDQLRAYGKH